VRRNGAENDPSLRKGAVNKASLKDWLGNSRRDEDEVELGAVRRLAATLDQDPSAYCRGSDVPESWYALLFGTLARQHTLGPDGHPNDRHLLPPFPGTRRMFGGRRTRFHRPLRVGESVWRLSTVTRAEPKTGRSGAFTLLTLLHEISGPSGRAVTEEQDVVYREAFAIGTTEPPRAVAPVAETGDWSRPFVVDPMLLFRYSALTFNAHRIHYDLDYVRNVEGYPGLVVNGGLTALLLVETARPHLPGRIAGYDARAISPLFAGETVTFNGRVTAGGASLWATGPNDGLAYRVDVTLEGQQDATQVARLTVQDEAQGEVGKGEHP
jgi:3-methylfumaryl-CoA hydratase